jgi:type I restriction enzyme R subunit
MIRTTAYVMRPYQVYAVEALVRQATLTNRNAYVWHTTGAGKTLTSFKTAQILAANPNIKKVIFLVDRKDLDSQTTEEFNKFENGSVDATDRTDVLVKQMQDKNRQLIVTTMQKMANAVKRPQYAKIMDAYKDEKVVFIIDESTEVSLAICIRTLCDTSRKLNSLALQNATL